MRRDKGWADPKTRPKFCIIGSRVRRRQTGVSPISSRGGVAASAVMKHLPGETVPTADGIFWTSLRSGDSATSVALAACWNSYPFEAFRAVGGVLNAVSNVFADRAFQAVPYAPRPLISATRARQGRFSRRAVSILTLATLLAALSLFAAWTWNGPDLKVFHSAERIPAPPPSPAAWVQPAERLTSP